MDLSNRALFGQVIDIISEMCDRMFVGNKLTTEQSKRITEGYKEYLMTENKRRELDRRPVLTPNDPAAKLQFIFNEWDLSKILFKKPNGQTDRVARSYVNILLDLRNAWAHPSLDVQDVEFGATVALRLAHSSGDGEAVLKLSEIFEYINQSDTSDGEGREKGAPPSADEKELIWDLYSTKMQYEIISKVRSDIRPGIITEFILFLWDNYCSPTDENINELIRLFRIISKTRAYKALKRFSANISKIYEELAPNGSADLELEVPMANWEFIDLLVELETQRGNTITWFRENLYTDDPANLLLLKLTDWFLAVCSNEVFIDLRYPGEDVTVNLVDWLDCSFLLLQYRDIHPEVTDDIDPSFSQEEFMEVAFQFMAGLPEDLVSTYVKAKDFRMLQRLLDGKYDRKNSEKFFKGDLSDRHVVALVDEKLVDAWDEKKTRENNDTPPDEGGVDNTDNTEECVNEEYSDEIEIGKKTKVLVRPGDYPNTIFFSAFGASFAYGFRKIKTILDYLPEVLKFANSGTILDTMKGSYMGNDMICLPNSDNSLVQFGRTRARAIGVGIIQALTILHENGAVNQKELQEYTEKWKRFQS